jgi:hypothetical protein
MVATFGVMTRFGRIGRQREDNLRPFIDGRGGEMGATT